LQLGQESPAVVGELDDLFRGGFPAEDRAQTLALIRVVSPHQEGRLAEYIAPASLPTGLMAYRIKCLADCDSGQQSPKVVPVAQLRELSPAGAIAEALEGAERHILLVEGTAAMGRQLRAGEPDQPLKVSIPEPLDIRTIAGLDPVEPECDCILLHH
jgi:hypothetical protein